METRVRAEGVSVRLSKWMRELEGAFYGSSTAYDAALAAPQHTPGMPDALAGALRRNVFMGEGAPGDAAALARYVRHVLACLALTPTEAVMAGACAAAQRGALLPACVQTHGSSRARSVPVQAASVITDTWGTGRSRAAALRRRREVACQPPRRKGSTTVLLSLL